MEILRVKIKGIRNISCAEIEFDNMTALVGLNGYGKSNIMNAIDFGIDFIKYQPSQKAKVMSSKNNIPILKSNAGQNFEFEIELKTVLNGESVLVLYGYKFSWSKNESPSKVIGEYLKIKSNDRRQKYYMLISRDEENAKYKRSETGRCNIKIKTDEESLVINKLMAYDSLYYIDIITQINELQFYIERHLDASSSFAPDPFVWKGFEELELAGINSVPRAIYFLKKEYSDKFNLLINAFKQLFPQIEKIDVSEVSLNYQPEDIKLSENVPFVYSDNIYTMNVIDKKLVQPINFEYLSDGAQRIFLMLTYAIIADIKGLSMIAIEEPENSIHPTLLQSYLDILSQLVNKCKIVFTSHSPYIIQYLNPRSIYIGLQCDDGSVDFRRIASTRVKSLMKDAEMYDKSVGDYIFNILSTADANESLKEYVESSEE